MNNLLLAVFVFAATAINTPVLAQQDSEAGVVLDEVILRNGSRILGTVTGARDGLVRVSTDFAGDLSISFENIASITTSEPMPLQLADRTVIKPSEFRLEGEQVAIAGVGGLERNYALEELRVLNPEPWELGDGYGWNGRLSFASSMQRGNSDINELDYLLDSRWRSDADRYTLQSAVNIVETNGVENANNWTVIGKYDHFVDEQSYWGMNAVAQHDDFANIDLRWYAGPYYGRDLFTDPIFIFSAELGVSFVSEDFIVGEDREYPAANWTLEMSSNYLGGESRMYLRQIGIWNLDETSDVVINTWTGISFPLLWSLEAALEVVLNFNSGIEEGVEELDETYRVRIGYSW